MTQGPHAPLPLQCLYLLPLSQELQRQSRGNHVPRPLTHGGRAVPDEIQSSNSKWETGGRCEADTAWFPAVVGLGKVGFGGWKPGMWAFISAPLFSWSGLQSSLQYANNVQILCVSLKKYER